MNTKGKLVKSFLGNIEGWKSVLDSSPDLIIILDTEFNIIWANKPMSMAIRNQKSSRVLNNSQNSCLELKCFEVIHGIKSPISGCPHAKMMQDCHEHSQEITDENLGGHFLTTVSPIKDESGNVLGSVHIARNINEDKKAKENIQRLADVVESSDDAIITKSFDGTVISWNIGAEQIYGYSAQEIMGKPISILEPPQLRRETKKLINKIKNGEKVDHYETLRLKKDGELINVSVTLSPVFSASGELVAISTIARDITERKMAEKQKQELLERTQQFAEELEVSNEELQVTTDELQTANLELQATTEELQVSNEELQDTTEELQAANEELRQQGDELLQINKSLLESEERFRALADNIPNLAWMANAEGWIFWYNKQWYDYTGTTLEEMQGWGWQKVHHPDYIDTVTEEWSKSIKEGKPYDNMFPLRGKNGKYHWFLTRVIPIHDEQGNIQRWFGTNTDITEQKKMEDELKTAKTNLELKIKERTRELIKSNEELKKEIIERKNAEKALTKSRNFLDKIINSIADPVFVKDKRHRWILLNDAFCKLMGYPREELLGKSDYNFLSAHEASIFWDKDEEVFKTGIENVNEEEVTDSEGNVHTLVTKKTLYSDNSGEKYLVAVIRDITELKDAENTIKKSESYYKTIFENTGAATFIVEEDTTISLVNAEFEKICGYSKEEIEGIKSWKEFVAPEYLKKMEEYHNFRRINLDRAPKKYEFKFVDRYGNIKNVLTTMDIISGTKKSLASLLDITDKKTAIDALRESEARLKIAMDMAKLVHWEYDVDLDLYTFDNQFYRLYGTTVDREGGSQMSSKEYAKRFLPPEESHMVMEGIAETLETDDPNFSKKSEHSIIRADGEKRFILVRCEIVKDAEGRTIKTYGVNQDITELKMAEKEIEENLKKLDVLNRVIVTANSSDNLQSLLKDILNLVLEFMNFEVGAIYLIDEKEGMAKLEHFTEDVNSFSIDNIKIDDYPFSKVYIEGLSLFVDDFDEIPPENLKPSNFESLAVVPIYSKEKIIGSFNILSRNKHYFTQKEKDIINSIGREIGSTISKLVTEEKMKKLITELKRSNDELRQFAYITSHDLQEPLRTIASFTQLLERRYKNKLDSDADEFIDYIVEASIRMKQMILDLLEYSRLTRVEKKCEPLKIEDMLLNIFDNLNLLIMENKAQITYENLPTVFADESQLFRVFQNLIENAIKFKKENEDPQIHISTYFDEKNKEHVFSVSDNGIGIEEQYFNRIFTLFQRLHTREEYEGTGIGLSISKRIIENHGGKMWVESEYGNGATFYFTIKNKS